MSIPVEAVPSPEPGSDAGEVTVTVVAHAGSVSPVKQLDMVPAGSSGVTTVFSSVSSVDAPSGNRTEYVTRTTPPTGSAPDQ
ncbi:MAG TPA: hypothetical protein VHU90_11710, partial [Galbitalea sp.]|nr:hypothetical protein [Galbitalea sp.]